MSAKRRRPVRAAETVALAMRERLSLYAASAITGDNYKHATKVARTMGYVPPHDHCTACGGSDHRARGKSCSPTYLAARDVIAGMRPCDAARKHGLATSGQLTAVVKRMRAYALRAEVQRAKEAA